MKLIERFDKKAEEAELHQRGRSTNPCHNCQMNMLLKMISNYQFNMPLKYVYTYITYLTSSKMDDENLTAMTAFKNSLKLSEHFQRLSMKKK